MSAVLTLAIPKGRLQKRVVEMLHARKFAISFEDRRLVSEDPSRGLRCLLVKNSDLPTYVHHGIAGLGVCGSDVIYESARRFVELIRFPFGSTKMCLAARRGDEAPSAHGTLRVATKFPRFARDFFHERGIPVDLIKLDGSVELAPVLGLAPYIVDLVETGSTLKANNLAVIDELAETHVSLVANPAFYKYHHIEIDALVRTLQEELT